jgi:hypothetical protein
MRKMHVVAALACIILMLEVGLGLEAWRSKATALQMLQTIDRFRLGMTSKNVAELELRQLGLAPRELACSTISGPCDNIGVELANFPESSQSTIALVQNFVFDRISIFRPTYLVGNFYFHSDRLTCASIAFSTNKSSIGTMIVSTNDWGGDTTVEWRRANHTGNETYVRILDNIHQQGASLNSAEIFDLGCMASIQGCNTASELWPSVSRYKTNQ